MISNNSEVSLVGGNNIYKITITSTDQKNTKEYKINVKVKQAVSLKDEIMKNPIIETEPTLTTSSNNSSDASGLYKSIATNTSEPTYYFRGNVENNYVKFAGQTWRIVRVNEDGTIKIVMQDGINDNTKYAFNSIKDNPVNMYYTNSDAKNQLESWYQTNIGNNTNLASKVATGAYYCEQAKVKKIQDWTSINATMTVYTSYIPNFKCSTDGNGKGPVNASIGLLNYDEIVYAGGYVSLDGKISNTLYYLYHSSFGWTMSPGGVVDHPCTWAYSSFIGSGNYVSTPGLLFPVLNLTEDIKIIGSGTSSDPFVVQ